MIFDTGASDVTISSVEANFMLKNDYLSSKDIKGLRCSSGSQRWKSSEQSPSTTKATNS